VVDSTFGLSRDAAALKSNFTGDPERSDALVASSRQQAAVQKPNWPGPSWTECGLPATSTSSTLSRCFLVKISGEQAPVP
jgi:hypothetical protein